MATDTATELWGEETRKAVANFPVSGQPIPLSVVRWLGRIKAAAARVNAELGLLDPEIAERIANAVLVKPNQVGTLSDAKRVVELARANGYATVLSARSGETEDTWLADLAVGWQTGQLKVGSTTRSERTGKWNRLLRLEAEHPDAVFAGRTVLAPL